jgi:hypothetical protein
MAILATNFHQKYLQLNTTKYEYIEIIREYQIGRYFKREKIFKNMVFQIHVQHLHDGNLAIRELYEHYGL